MTLGDLSAVHGRMAFGQGAGLVDDQRVDLLEPFERLGVADQDAAARAAAHAHHDRHRGQPQRAWTGDDQHRNGGGCARTPIPARRMASRPTRRRGWRARTESSRRHAGRPASSDRSGDRPSPGRGREARAPGRPRSGGSCRRVRGWVGSRPRWSPGPAPCCRSDRIPGRAGGSAGASGRCRWPPPTLKRTRPLPAKDRAPARR